MSFLQSFSSLDQEMSALLNGSKWTHFRGSVFNPRNEYRVVFLKGQGHVYAESVNPKCLLFGVSEAAHVYGAVDAAAPNQWYMVSKRFLHKCDSRCYPLFAIEERAEIPHSGFALYGGSSFGNIPEKLRAFQTENQEVSDAMCVKKTKDKIYLFPPKNSDDSRGARPNAFEAFGHKVKVLFVCESATCLATLLMYAAQMYARYYKLNDKYEFLSAAYMNGRELNGFVKSAVSEVFDLEMNVIEAPKEISDGLIEESTFIIFTTPEIQDLVRLHLSSFARHEGVVEKSCLLEFDDDDYLAFPSTFEKRFELNAYKFWLLKVCSSLDRLLVPDTIPAPLPNPTVERIKNEHFNTQGMFHFPSKPNIPSLVVPEEDQDDPDRYRLYYHKGLPHVPAYGFKRLQRQNAVEKDGLLQVPESSTNPKATYYH